MMKGRAAAAGTSVVPTVIVAIIIEIVATGVGGTFLLDQEMEKLA
jgi:hypothetical protein